MTTPVVPVAPVVPKPVTPTPTETKPPIDYAAEQTKLDNAQRAIEQKERAHVLGVRKFAEEKKTMGEKLSAASRYEKERAQAKLNPDAFLRGVYGEDYQKFLDETRANGAPPANIIAAEMATLEERVEKRLADRDAAANAARAEQQRADADHARVQLRAENLAFLEKNAKDYPIFANPILGGVKGVAALLASRIESEYNRTERRDPATRQVIQPGRILTTKEAADLLESEILAISEEAAAHEKYQPKLLAKLKPTPPALGVPTQQQRRTLSNDLTGSTPATSSPPATDAERRERALAARNAAIAGRTKP